MRKTLIAAALLATATLPTTTAAAATKTRALTAHQVAPRAAWLGTPDAATAAFRTVDPGPAVTRTDAGAVATVPAPDGCGAGAAGGGRIAYVCGTDSYVPDGMGTWFVRHLAVTSTTGGEVVRLDQRTAVGADGLNPSALGTIGAQWIRSIWAEYHAIGYVYVNWRTGEQRQGQPTDPAHPDDLDAPGLTGTLCAPLKAVVQPVDQYANVDVRMPPVTVRGRWVLITRSLSPARATLHPCGRAAAVALPAGFGAPVLGDGWLAQQHADGVHLLRLSDRRQFRVPGMKDARVLHFTKGRLYSEGRLDDAGGAGALHTVVLPKR